MEQIMCGMLARSKAGHDAKTLYLVCRTEGDFVYLCDGRLRKFDSPKKKNKKHIQIIHKIPEALANWNGEALRDEKIRSILKDYKMKEVHDVESRCNSGGRNSTGETAKCNVPCRTGKQTCGTGSYQR